MIDDVRQTLRSLLRSPGAALGAALALAGGIGAALLVFAVVDPLLFRPLPVKDAGMLVRLYANPMGESVMTTHAAPVLDDYLGPDGATAFSTIVRFTTADPVSLSATGGPAEIAAASLVGGGFFDLLGIRASRGRLIGPDDDRAPGAHPVAVLSDVFWRARFGGDTSVVGKTVRVNGHPFEVIGVAPRDFRGADAAYPVDLWLPVAMAEQAYPQLAGEDLFHGRALGWLDAVGRLAPGATLESAQAQLDAIATRRAAGQPEKRKDPRSVAVSYRKAFLGLDAASATVQLAKGFLLAAGLLVVLATAVSSSLLLVRGERRRKETAVRTSLGAPPARLLAPVLVESLSLSAAGAGLGLLLAHVALAALRAATAGLDTLPIPVVTVGLGRREAAAAVALALVTGLLGALLPAFRALATSRNSSLRAESAGRHGRVPLGGALVIAQVSVSVVLLLGAGLMARALGKTLQADPGFDADHALAGSFNLARQGYTPEAGARVMERILESVRAVPGVTAAALARSVPVQRSGMIILLPGPDHPLSELNVVTPEYFRAAGIRLVEGRDFSDRDVKGSPPVGIVNEEFARRFLKDGPVLGRTLHDVDSLDVQVIGVVRTARVRSLREEPRPMLYVPLAQSYQAGMTLVARTAGDPALALPHVRQAIAWVDADLPFSAAGTLRQRLGASLAQDRLLLSLLGSFGTLALSLAALGLFSVVSHATDLRRRELGVRLAVGAGPRDLLRLVLRQGLTLGVAGLVVGGAASIPLAPLLRDVLFGVTLGDAGTWAAVGSVLLGACLLASAAPARRALRLDPVVALRGEG